MYAYSSARERRDAVSIGIYQLKISPFPPLAHPAVSDIIGPPLVSDIQNSSERIRARVTRLIRNQKNQRRSPRADNKPEGRKTRRVQV